LELAVGEAGAVVVLFTGRGLEKAVALAISVEDDDAGSSRSSKEPAGPEESSWGLIKVADEDSSAWVSFVVSSATTSLNGLMDPLLLLLNMVMNKEVGTCIYFFYSSGLISFPLGVAREAEDDASMDMGCCRGVSVGPFWLWG
jgi:hypothetical protein